MKHTEETPQDFLQARLARIRERNPRFSLRALASRSGVPASSLSDFLRGRKSLSVESALKLSLYLGLSPIETEYFLVLLQRDSLLSTPAKGVLTGKIDGLRESLHSAQAQRIRQLLADTEVRAAHHYALPGSLDRRSLVLLRDRKTNREVRAFYDHFSAPERIVASNSYFLPNPDGTFRVYLVEASQGDIIPTLQCPENLTLKVHFDADGFPQIENLHMKRLGTSLYSVVKLEFSVEKVVQTGIRYDHERPDFRQNFQTIFKKMSLSPKSDDRT